MASFYAEKYHGRKTANGETFNMNDLTAAHKTLAFNTRLRVTYLKTKKSVIVRVNDRGPFVGNRVLDLSRAAAIEIGLFDDGVGEVLIEIL
ncbi:MAG: septal ring lytic transglycosylase RlpA family protein [Calditrichaeota bacterium]|nr:septal ring lytic transglycosylase RlpA family protein [Calditrichota bacterium]